jgi:hypothetical protein
MASLSTVVAVIIAISVASERLAEIIKGVVPALNTKRVDNSRAEEKRAAKVRVLAVGTSIFTALLCWAALARLVPTLEPTSWAALPAILALGFLASGGSAFWNSILTYILKLKDIEAVAAKTAQRALREEAAVQKPVDFKIVA